MPRESVEFGRVGPTTRRFPSLDRGAHDLDVETGAHETGAHRGRACRGCASEKYARYASFISLKVSRVGKPYVATARDVALAHPGGFQNGVDVRERLRRLSRDVREAAPMPGRHACDPPCRR